jgi:hypothetical protein
MKDEIKKTIVSVVTKKGDLTFSELMKELSRKQLPVKGEKHLLARKNLFIWDNTSSEFNNALTELIASGIITIQAAGKKEAQTPKMFSCGLIPLPIADRWKAYATPHWLPTIVKLKEASHRTES